MKSTKKAYNTQICIVCCVMSDLMSFKTPFAGLGDYYSLDVFGSIMSFLFSHTAVSGELCRS
jgi:hypothetical protein